MDPFLFSIRVCPAFFTTICGLAADNPDVGLFGFSEFHMQFPRFETLLN